MGLFDKFKKDKNDAPTISTTQVPQKSYDANFKATKDGKLQLDFYDREAKFQNFYDTTRLLVDGNPVNIDGIDVYKCMVSWYGNQDCQIMDEETGELNSPRAVAYTEILAQIDLIALQNDQDYCQFLMRQLLKQSRVEDYMLKGLQDSPDTPCGNYVGGVRKLEDKYEKFFDVQIGKKCHYSNLMAAKRQEYREQLRVEREKELANKREQMEKLQQEVDNLSR